MSGLDQTVEFLSKLPRLSLIGIMWAALDEMQSYNGQTRLRCILKAIDAEEREKDDCPGELEYVESR